MKSILRIIFIAMLPALILAESNLTKDAQDINVMFDKALQLYKSGNVDGAKRVAQMAYFSHFENLEGPIRINFSQKKSHDMESQFGQIREAIVNGDSYDSIKARIDQLKQEIAEVMPTLQTGYQLVAQQSDTPKDPAPSISNASPWKTVYEQISAKLAQSKQDFDNNNLAGIKTLLNNDIKFNLYRNTHLEIAIRTYISQSYDQQIQQTLDEILMHLSAMNKIQFYVLTNQIDDMLLKAVAQLPSKSYALAPVQDKKTVTKQVDLAQVTQTIGDKMDKIIALYKAGNIQDAVSKAQDIYFDNYEGSGMEDRVGAGDPGLKSATEATFGKIVSLMQSKASVSQVEKAKDQLMQYLQKSVDKFGGTKTPWQLFIYSLILIVREGFEALIIVAAVVAYLVKTGNSNKLGLVYSAVATAVGLSFVVAYGLRLIFESAAGQSREILEGITILFAVVLLYYVGFWLLSNAGAKKWTHYIQSHVGDSLSTGSRRALWWTTFLAVFREGAELVLFYQSLFIEAQGGHAILMIISGFIAGLVIILITFFIFKMTALRIPIKPFFIVTSAIIFYMSIAFFGNGIMELVNGKVLTLTPINGFPRIDILGIYPYYETIIPQICMIIGLIIGIIIIKAKQKIS